MSEHKIALIPGDGIGVDVTEAAMKVMHAVAGMEGFTLCTETLPWSCAYYHETGAMMPDDGIETLRGFDAIFLGAVGWPESVPDAVSLHGLLLPIRKAFDNSISARIVCYAGRLKSAPSFCARHRASIPAAPVRIGRTRWPQTGLHAQWGGAHPALRVRAGTRAARPPDLGHQVERATVLHGFLG
ncbi:MAG: isocitrate/isopropylmalate family dehydrogenase [Roseovarius sp.]